MAQISSKETASSQAKVIIKAIIKVFKGIEALTHITFMTEQLNTFEQIDNNYLNL